jgi:hypothetical protein
LRIQASSGRGAGITFEITKPDREHAVGGVTPISVQTSPSEPSNIAGFAWIVVAFNVAVAMVWA